VNFEAYFTLVAEANEEYKRTGFEATVTYLSEKKENGDPNALTVLADLYRFYFDNPSEEMTQTIINAYAAAIELGNSMAAYRLATFYCEKWPDSIIHEGKAFQYFLTSAKDGYSDALGMVANFYFHGRGNCEVDYLKAIRYAVEATEEGSPLGMEILGTCYMDGLGVQRDVSKAAYYFKMSIEDGNQVDEDHLNIYPVRLIEIAICLCDPFNEYGITPTKEMLKEGLSYVKKSLEYDYDYAHILFAWFLEKGVVVDKDYNQSYEHLAIAASKGNSFASDLLKRYRKTIFGEWKLINS